MQNNKFIAGKTYIPVSGKVFDEEEINNAIEVAKEGWWTEGRWTKEFEREFKKFLGVHYVSLVNSGSSANLVALACLTSTVFGKRQLKPGDEYITTSVAFPTTVNPGIQYGLKPIFIDAKLDTLNIDVSQIEKAITKKTKLIMVAHTLGKPYDLEKITKLSKKYNLWVIEDSCDALGGKYKGKMVGTWGDIATYSFYPAHQCCMGEAGAVVTNNSLIHKSIRQFRDWGRDCWCDTGKDNTCRKRFGWKLGELPQGYDHKYIYSQIGYNLKSTDFQAAIGCAQLKKLPGFVKKRQENYKILYKFFSQYKKYFILMKTDKNEEVSYFGFPAIVKPSAPFTRNELTEYLEKNKIGTRNIFSGNLLRHPAYVNRKKNFKIIGDHKNADLIMNNAFWLGVYPGITKEIMEYIKEKIVNFLEIYNIDK
ncbi:MAG: DegT/DnrJ/EryC1/StrS aminotransferase family enzyme [Candidatus Roizmanbacteria bacterium GW2011_GWA2_32_13]|uniref:DegT/DnrJ/EryC1/StrS aminotransferase family enzyme n=1 Tax=Candidatus Roizmanbacteria bacterium GW2011_GWA2_32_13 TaxID=1618475 RepID=A0A0F9Z8A8_9BACT|nr:MAG: DegT/DnrJ/EryC1/StrS aminotransferase family enzyme [Candidatus Roizmanbacteria bacterium GW2011_GWA2_32_13]